MNYLDTDKQIKLFQKASDNNTYVDKTLLIQKVSQQMESGNGYLCITCSRRFGKYHECKIENRIMLNV